MDWPERLLKKQPKAIVRVFNPACTSYACKPLSVIDNDYYKTSLQPLYLRYFTNELVGQFYFFEDGKLMKVVDEL